MSVLSGKSTGLLMALTLVGALASSPSLAQSADTLAAADRLMAAQNVDGMVSEMARATASTLNGASEAQKQAFVAAMTDKAFIGRFRYETRTAMARHFSTDELNALADFYSRPVAKSAMSKMGPYTADVMAFVQREIPELVQRMQTKP